MIRAGVKYKFILDQLGSVRIVVNTATGEIKSRMDYDEFGKLQAGALAPTFTPFNFAGGIRDAASGLIRFGVRDYDPLVGRWTSKDPILFRGGDTNLYGYVINDPINLIDPTGLYWFRQPWQERGIVGRRDTIVPPKGAVSDAIERYVPAGYTFGENHDAFVDWTKSKGVPDWLANIPSMIPLYVYSIGLETGRSLGLADQPGQVCK